MKSPTAKVLTGAPRASELDWGDEAYANASEASSNIDDSRAKFGQDTPQFRSLRELPDERRRDDIERTYHDNFNPARKPNRPAQPHKTPVSRRAPSSSADTQNAETTIEDITMEEPMAEVTVPADMTLEEEDDNIENLFLSTGKATKFKADSTEDQKNEDKLYLEQSFQFYDNSLFTQLSISPSPSQESTQESTQPLSTSEGTTSTPAASAIPIVPLPSPVVDLEDLPDAAYIERIFPQTITVHLIVSVANIVPPRRITLKQTKKKMDLVEMIVADETRSGFQVSFWLLPDSEGKDVLRRTLKELKPRDIIVLKNVALHVWNGKVFGQSLRKRWTKTETTAQILGRKGELGIRISDELAVAPERTKLQRVHQYARDFLGPAPVIGWSYKRVEDKEEVLPPETQSQGRRTRRGTEFG
jgi:hypothetical protein